MERIINEPVKKRTKVGMRTTYPAQVKLGENLQVGDQKMLIEKSGYAASSISRMFDGTLKMSDEIWNFTELIIANRNELESIDISQFASKSNSN